MQSLQMLEVYKRYQDYKELLIPMFIRPSMSQIRLLRLILPQLDKNILIRLSPAISMPMSLGERDCEMCTCMHGNKV